MTIIFQIRPNPVRFLLLIECLMLLSCGCLAIIETFEKGQLPIQHFLILFALGLMGWLFPTGHHWVKILYTSIEMGLIFYGTILGYLHILPSLYLIVVIRSCFMFNLMGRTIIAVLSLFFFSIHKVFFFHKVTAMVDNTDAIKMLWTHQFAEVLMFAVGLFFVLQFVSTWLSEKISRQQLAGANDQLKDYALKIESLAALQERNRIARDIHDSLGHSLTALNIQLQTALKLWDIKPKEVRPFLEQSQRLGEIAMRDVRQSVRKLRVEDQPTVSLKLEMEIASLVKDFRQNTGINVKAMLKIPADIDSETVKTIYRVVQEALTNICKHAQAKHVKIRLYTRKGQIRLVIADDGRGFTSNDQKNGFGLQGMKERVESIQGRLKIFGNPQNGCQVLVELPIKPVNSQQLIDQLQLVKK